jgi:hypothetical protein
MKYYAKQLRVDNRNFEILPNRGLEMNWSQEKYIRAYRFAAEAHNNQKFPGTELPYLVHVGLVSMEIMASLSHSDGVDGDLAIQCALLHDVIEDTEITFSEVKFEEAVLKAVNLGGDADTTGAICGQIAGAYYGETNIPNSWLDNLVMANDIRKISDQLMSVKDK